MQSSSCGRGVTGFGFQLSTRTSLFSTRYAHALQVRDLDFVKRTRRATYLGTGADSRVGLASAPALQKQVARVSMDPLSLFPSATRRTALPRPSLSCSSASVTV